MIGLLLALTLLGCSSEREQALALLERVSAIDISELPAKRMPQLTALESLRLRDEPLRQLQSLCASAHRALIDSEVEQAKARHSLDNATDDKTPEQRAARAETISTSIERSTAKLKQAQQIFPECERQTRALALRFPRSQP